MQLAKFLSLTLAGLFLTTELALAASAPGTAKRPPGESADSRAGVVKPGAMPTRKPAGAAAQSDQKLTKHQQARQAALKAKRDAKKAEKLAARQAARRAQLAEKHGRRGGKSLEAAPGSAPKAPKKAVK